MQTDWQLTGLSPKLTSPLLSRTTPRSSSTSPAGIDFTLFLTMFSEHLLALDPEPEQLEAFACFDPNDTGLITGSELRKWLGTEGEKMSQAEVGLSRSSCRPSLEEGVHRSTLSSHRPLRIKKEISTTGILSKRCRFTTPKNFRLSRPSSRLPLSLSLKHVYI